VHQQAGQNVRGHPLTAKTAKMTPLKWLVSMDVGNITRSCDSVCVGVGVGVGVGVSVGVGVGVGVCCIC